MEDKVLEALRKAAKALKSSEIAASAGLEKAKVDKAVKKTRRRWLDHQPEAMLLRDKEIVTSPC
ncbi:MAG: hypothetical protein JW861_01225 [Bacteroidales bacterium]|nr:hypothetical protein [Bacteroidales bacterium]